jgi:serine/threonine-protein kinase HipA
MNSSRPGTFVFVQLPATNEIVVAGRYEMETTITGSVGHFVYGRSYLDRTEAVALDPINLPLAETTYLTTLNRGLFGALRDAAPDFWGRVVIERTHRPASELDYLLATSDVRVGALSFGPTPIPPQLDYGAGVPMAKLERAAAAAASVEAAMAGEVVAVELDPALLEPSSGIGGARPKTVVVDDDAQLWIAKFPSRTDRWDNALAEALYLRLARECEIRVPETRVLRIAERLVLLVRRFDQSPGPVRRPFLSAHSVLALDEGVVDRAGWSYVDLAHVMRRISARPEEDARELFRRAVFNALTSNTDDHPRNHAMVYEDEGWRLSPAYDLTPSAGRAEGERLLAMAVGTLPGVNARWANRGVLLSGAAHFGYEQDEAEALITAMKEHICEVWRTRLFEIGGTPVLAEQVAHAFPDRYPGFEYEV